MLRSIVQALAIYAILAIVFYVYTNRSRLFTSVGSYRKKYRALFGEEPDEPQETPGRLERSTRPQRRSFRDISIDEEAWNAAMGYGPSRSLQEPRRLLCVDRDVLRKLVDDDGFIEEAAMSIYRNRRMRYRIYVEKLEGLKQKGGDGGLDAMGSLSQSTHEKQIRNMTDILARIEESLGDIGPQEVRNRLLSVFYDPRVGMDSIVGRDDVKDLVCQRIYMFVTDPESLLSRYLNMAFLGGSGVGKTRLARFVSHAYNRAGIFAKDRVLEAQVKDFMSPYVASGSYMTQALLDSGLETVVFFDEAYGLGGSSLETQVQSGAFSTMVSHTDVNKGLSAVIVCGYADRMQRDFFGMNEGLERRFPDRFHIRDYSADELTQIFISFLEDADVVVPDQDADIAYTLIKGLYLSKPWLFLRQAGDMEKLADAFVEIHRTLLDTDSQRDVFGLVMRDAISRLIASKS